MKTDMPYLNELGILCALGNNENEVREALVTRDKPVPSPEKLMQPRFGALCAVVGLADQSLPPVPKPLENYDCRNNRLAMAALEQIRSGVDAAKTRYGAHRIGVVMGTSTSGIAASEEAVREIVNSGEYPEDYHAVQGVLGGLGEFVGLYLGVTGPVSTLSTACSSSANAMLSARRLLKLNLCDVVVVGGVDSLCGLTVGGFGSLEALSASLCRPFSAARDGINIGEAAAVFLMSNEPGPVRLFGGAATSDAHHISAPHPEGEGAHAAMEKALQDAQLEPDDIDYLNAHGTGTEQNDAMESKAIYRLLGAQTPCGSSKSMTGHTLGAAGALELAFCWLLLTQGSNSWRLPPSLYAQELDDELAEIQLTGSNSYTERAPQYCMSNSFAFGGSNVSLVVGRGVAGATHE